MRAYDKTTLISNNTSHIDNVGTHLITIFDCASLKSGAEDSLGNKYAKALVLSRYGQTPYAQYYLGGQYKQFKCQFACSDNCGKSDYQFEIYGDDEGLPIYSLDFTRALPVTSIDVDVTGVEFLTFKISKNTSYGGGIIADGMLYTQ